MKKLIAFCILLSCLHGAGAAEVFGTVDALSGSASVMGQDGQSSAISVGMKIYEGDTLSSAHDGEVHVVTEDGGFIALRPDTVFRVDQYKAEGGPDDRTFMSLLKGAVRSITGWIGKHDSSAYRLTTPTATVGIRGTDHEVTVVDKGGGDEPGTYDTVNEGSTVLKTPQGEVVTTPGKFAFAPRGRAVAPMFLQQRPRFLATRTLRIEGRVQQRREYLRGQMEQMRQERIQSIRQQRGQPRGDASMQPRAQGAERRDELRGAGRDRGQAAMERRNELREERRNRMMENRQTYRERRGELRQRGEGGAEGGQRAGRRARRERE
jgi:hypothetical protein